MGKPEWEGSLEKRGHEWEDDIKVDLKEIDWKGVNWIISGLLL